MPEHWCTVTVTDANGRRHSLDVIASSTYDAAHLYVTHAKAQPQAGLPAPTLATVFEVVNGGKVYTPSKATRSSDGLCSAGRSGRDRKACYSVAGPRCNQRTWVYACSVLPAAGCKISLHAFRALPEVR